MANHIAAPYRIDRNPDGFSHPAAGGTLATKTNTVAYTDTTAKTLFTLPLGAVIVGWITNVSTAFNDTGTDLLDIGVSGAVQQYAASLNVSAVGQITYGYVPSQLFTTPLASEVTVIATYTGGNSDASAGAATVAVLYYTQEYAS